jgi:EmrB/QacA subfamily drug resistance transporter
VTADSSDITDIERPVPKLRGNGRDPAILKKLNGLMLALFVSMLSTTIVAPALPTMIGDIGGGPTAYAWTLTSLMLTSTATVPIWGRMGDLFDKKKLLMLALVIFVIGGALCGLAQSPGQMIAMRAVQGLGVGGVQVMVQSIMASFIPPRERVRYNGYYSSVAAIATISGPIVGGLLVGVPGVGWRSCFWATAPFAAVAIIGINRRLHLEHVRHEVRIDYAGGGLLSGGVVVFLIWVSTVGSSFALVSWPTLVMLVPSIAAVVLAIKVEQRVPQPVLPVKTLRMRGPALTAIASVGVGVSMFAGAVFLSQYLQVGRGISAFDAGLLQLPSAIGTLVASMVTGRILARTGRLKPVLFSGVSLIFVSYAYLTFADATTPIWTIAVALGVSGAGVGMTYQNLVTSIQNSVSIKDVGAASAAISFVRSLSGTIGLQCLTAILAIRIVSVTEKGFRDAGLAVPDTVKNASLDLDSLTDQGRQIVRTGYANTMWLLFLICAIAILVSVVAVASMRPTVLRTTIDTIDSADTVDPSP